MELQGGIYQTRATLDGLLQDLARIDALAVKLKQGRSRLKWAAGIVLVSGMVVAMFGHKPAAAFIGLFTAFGLFVYSFLYGREVLDHPVRARHLRDLTGILRSDTAPEQTFALSLGLKEREALLHEEPWTRRTKGKQQFLKDEWLSLQGGLLDGAVFSQTIADLIRRRTYTNPRGKKKTKLRRRSVISLRLTYPADVYGDASTVRVPLATPVKSLKVTPKHVTVKGVARTDADLKKVNALLFLTAYRILNHARSVAAR